MLRVDDNTYHPRKQPHVIVSHGSTKTYKGYPEKKKKAYNKARSIKKKEEWASYKKLKKDSQRECRRAYSPYVNNLVSDNQSGNPKRLYPFINSKKCDASGVAPLSSNGVNHSDIVKKVNILNDQFTYVFTKEDLSSLSLN